jgi:hypothetical protein
MAESFKIEKTITPIAPRQVAAVHVPRDPSVQIGQNRSKSVLKLVVRLKSVLWPN